MDTSNQIPSILQEGPEAPVPNPGGGSVSTLSVHYGTKRTIAPYESEEIKVTFWGAPDPETHPVRWAKDLITAAKLLIRKTSLNPPDFGQLDKEALDRIQGPVLGSLESQQSMLGAIVENTTTLQKALIQNGQFSILNAEQSLPANGNGGDVN